MQQEQHAADGAPVIDLTSSSPFALQGRAAASGVIEIDQEEARRLQLQAQQQRPQTPQQRSLAQPQRLQAQQHSHAFRFAFALLQLLWVHSSCPFSKAVARAFTCAASACFIGACSYASIMVSAELDLYSASLGALSAIGGTALWLLVTALTLAFIWALRVLILVLRLRAANAREWMRIEAIAAADRGRARPEVELVELFWQRMADELKCDQPQRRQQSVSLSSEPAVKPKMLTPEQVCFL